MPKRILHEKRTQHPCKPKMQHILRLHLCDKSKACRNIERNKRNLAKMINTSQVVFHKETTVAVPNFKHLGNTLKPDDKMTMTMTMKNRFNKAKNYLGNLYKIPREDISIKVNSLCESSGTKFSSDKWEKPNRQNGS